MLFLQQNIFVLPSLVLCTVSLRRGHTNSSKCDVSAKDVSETLCAVCAHIKKIQISFYKEMLQVTLLSNLCARLNYCCSQTAHRQHSAAEIRELTSLFFWLISICYVYVYIYNSSGKQVLLKTIIMRRIHVSPCSALQDCNVLILS